MNNGIYGGKQMASERSAYPNDYAGVVPQASPVGVLGQAIGTAPAPMNLLTIIDMQREGLDDVRLILQRIARIGAVLGRNTPVQSNEKVQRADPQHLIAMLTDINLQQRSVTRDINVLVTEIEQTLGM